MEKTFCKNCVKRGTCRAICPELEIHLKEDIEVPQREFTIGLILYPIREWSTMKDKIRLSPRQAELVSLLLQGYEKDYIMEKLILSSNTYDKQLQRIRDAINKHDSTSSKEEENKGGPDPIPPDQKGGCK